MRADFDGVVMTNEDGECCILASSAKPRGTGAAAPLAVTNLALGGGILGHQDAVWGWVWMPNDAGEVVKKWSRSMGLNNIGLLVKIYGRVTKGVADGFYLEDGSKLTDETGNTGIKVWTGTSGASYEGAYLMVTGVASCRKSGSTIYPQILARDILSQ